MRLIFRVLACVCALMIFVPLYMNFNLERKILSSERRVADVSIGAIVEYPIKGVNVYVTNEEYERLKLEKIFEVSGLLCLLILWVIGKIFVRPVNSNK